MGEMLFRTVEPDLSVRSDGRTVYGIVVPYKAKARIYDDPKYKYETIAPGAFNHQLSAPQRIMFEREHVVKGGSVIGAGALMRDDPEGLYMEFRVSKTTTGDETLELLRDGGLRQLSVGMFGRQDRALSRDLVERVTADLHSVAVVYQGAYGDLAMVGGVRSGDGAPGESTDLDLHLAVEDILRTGLPDLPDHRERIRILEAGL